MKRFEVMQQEAGSPHVDAFWIRDNDAHLYEMPVKAVSLHVRHRNADLLCELLNEEWAAFLAGAPDRLETPNSTHRIAAAPR